MLLDIFFIVIFLSFLVLVHEAGHFLAAKFFGLRVDEFGFGFPPRIFAGKIGETEYSLNWFPLGGFVKIYGEEKEEIILKDTNNLDYSRSFNAQTAWKKTIIIIAGVFMNFLAGWLVLSAVFMIGSQKVLLITDVQSGSPAETAGLKKNDQIIEIKIGDLVLKNPTENQQFINFVNQYRGREFLVVVQRAGKIENFMVGSRIDPPIGQGSMGVGIIGAGIEKRPFFTALQEGFKASWQAAGIIITALYQLLTQSLSKPEILQGVVGPVGIFSVASQANAVGFVYFLQLIGLISVNLAVLNFVPFPALDGGRLLFILIEKIKGSPFKPRIEKIANVAGMALLLFLMAAITIRDIVRLF